AHEVQEAVIPLLGGEVLAHGGEVEDDDRTALLLETRGRAHHERRFPHLPRSEHVAELALLKGGEKLLVRPPGGIGGRVPGDGAAGEVKTAVSRQGSVVGWCHGPPRGKACR